MEFAPGCFLWPNFWRSFPYRNFAKSQKMRDGGVFPKFVIARLYGHFGSRGLQQNVVLCLHFKCIEIRR